MLELSTTISTSRVIRLRGIVSCLSSFQALQWHMASGLPSIQHPRTPSPPTLVEPPVDDDRDDDAASAKRNSGNWNDIDGLLSTSASSRRSAFLHPDSQSFLRPPSMSFDDAPGADGAAPAPAAASPFNFQTQYITTSPVKSVR